MFKTLQISIPTPCGENWDEMTTVQQGRYCQSCSKTVVDFSAMSDQQVFTYFSKAPAHVCGRFSGGQLNRDLFPPVEKRPGWLRHLLYLLFPALLLSKGSSAQKIRVAPDSIHLAPPILPVQPLVGHLGGVSFGVKIRERSVAVSGRVVDEKGMALPGAAVMIKGSHKGTVTDEKGAFTLQCTGVDETTLVASYIGYERQEITLDTRKNKRANFIMSQAVNVMQGEVIVGGLVAVVKKPVSKKTFIVTPQKSITVAPPVTMAQAADKVKLYPNPLPAGSSFTVEMNIEQPGAYLLHLVDLSGRTILQKTIHTDSKDHREIVTLDSRVLPGIYAVELTDAAGKRIRTEKLLVQ